MPSRLTAIVVRSEDWYTADPADRMEYEAAAESQTIVLIKAQATAADVLVVVREGNPRRWTEVAFYDGFVGCSRSPWEHEVRQLLGLEDPCFGDDPSSDVGVN